MKIITGGQVINVSSVGYNRSSESANVLQFPKNLWKGNNSKDEEPASSSDSDQELSPEQITQLKAEWQAAKQTGDEAKKAKIKKILKGVGIGVGVAALAGAGAAGSYMMGRKSRQGEIDNANKTIKDKNDTILRLNSTIMHNLTEANKIVGTLTDKANKAKAAAEAERIEKLKAQAALAEAQAKSEQDAMTQQQLLDDANKALKEAAREAERYRNEVERMKNGEQKVNNGGVPEGLPAVRMSDSPYLGDHDLTPNSNVSAPSAPSGATGKYIHPTENRTYTEDIDIVRQNANPGDWITNRDGSVSVLTEKDILDASNRNAKQYDALYNPNMDKWLEDTKVFDTESSTAIVLDNGTRIIF